MVPTAMNMIIYVHPMSYHIQFCSSGIAIHHSTGTVVDISHNSTVKEMPDFYFFLLSLCFSRKKG